MDSKENIADASPDENERAFEEYSPDMLKALRSVFEDVRRQSARSKLVTPERWEETGIIPSSIEPDEFEMIVYTYWEEHRNDQSADAIGEEKPVYRSATTAVGIPQPIGIASEQDENEDTEASMAEVSYNGESDASEPAAEESGVKSLAPEEPATDTTDAADAIDTIDTTDTTDTTDTAGLAAPKPELGDALEGYELVQLEGEWCVVPVDDCDSNEDFQCDDIVALTGKYTYYLYSTDFMTDKYAHWAFLSQEDNRVITFIDCVREESRVYPRPMPASSLTNPPFSYSDEDIDTLWTQVSTSGHYPDIGQTVASNGDVYYYSTDFLSDVYAASLAEWDAVDRYRNL